MGKIYELREQIKVLQNKKNNVKSDNDKNLIRKEIGRLQNEIYLYRTINRENKINDMLND